MMDSFDSLDVPYSSWGVNSSRVEKLHEDSYRRQLRNAQKQAESDRAKVNDTMTQCSFKPVIAPGSTKQRKERTGTVFERLNAEARVVEAKRNVLRNAELLERKRKEDFELTFQPETTIPVDPEVGRVVTDYCSSSAHNRLYDHALRRKAFQPSEVNVTPRPHRDSKFRPETASRLSQVSVSKETQVRELQRRIAETEVLTFHPLTTRPPRQVSPFREPSETRTNSARRVANEFRCAVALDEQPLRDASYRDRREVWLKKRGERQGTDRSAVYDDASADNPVVKRMESKEVAGTISRLYRTEVACQSETKLGRLRDDVAEKDVERRRAVRQKQLEVYNKMKTEGLFTANLVDKRSSSTKRTPSQPLTPPPCPQSTPAAKPSSRYEQRKKAAAEKLAVRRERAEEIRKTSEVRSRSLPKTDISVVRRSPAIAVRGADSYHKRIQDARQREREAAEERMQRFQPAPSAVVRRVDPNGRMVTDVQPFQHLSEHEQEMERRKNELMAQYMTEVRESVCTFNPVTCTFDA